jgi:hypothetical protein
MKMLRCFLKSGVFLSCLFFALFRGTDAIAQVGYPIPIVTIQATQPIASGPGAPGVFTLFRQGNTNAALNVYYNIGGSASNGVDYATISQFTLIPAGATSNNILIKPLNSTSSSAAAKTVILQLAASPLMIPVNYQIGVPSNAVVYIGTNLPPEVNIISPTNGSVFYTPTNILLEASVSDPDSTITNVEFFAGTNDLGPGSEVSLGPSGMTGVYIFEWQDVPVGNYPLTAVATDENGVSGVSPVVNISVLPGTTNLPPVVNIISPKDGSVFYTPTNIMLVAKAADPDGSVTNVEFFAGTNDLGPGSQVVLEPPGINGVTGPVFIFNWLNVPVGNFPLTAVATDNGGASTVSPVVNISVLQNPVTNPPPSVRIISPPNGSIFFAPVNIPLFAGVTFSGQASTQVQFFDGTNFIGSGQPVPSPVIAGGAASPGPIPIGYPTNVFFLVWTNPPLGSNVLTAVAVIAFETHPLATRITSPPVDITVLPEPPPQTNRPPILSIVATDPVAVEGTNCWVWPGETNAIPTWAAWASPVRCFYTNCGPKTATFTVRRFGETNDDVTAQYNIGGTASNGVDYVALTGSVTISAGHRRAFITIVPIDDGPPDVNKTVILALAPSTNTPPDYCVGFPPRAAAIIIDPPGPGPVAGALPDKCFRLSMPGPDAAWFSIEYSSNLSDWTPICTNQVVNGSIDFIDPDAAVCPGRFYRAVPVTNAPSE